MEPSHCVRNRRSGELYDYDTNSEKSKFDCGQQKLTDIYNKLLCDANILKARIEQRFPKEYDDYETDLTYRTKYKSIEYNLKTIADGLASRSVISDKKYLTSDDKTMKDIMKDTANRIVALTDQV